MNCRIVLPSATVTRVNSILLILPHTQYVANTTIADFNHRSLQHIANQLIVSRCKSKSPAHKYPNSVSCTTKMAKVIIIAIISATLITAVVSAAVGGDPGESGCTCGVFPDNSPIPIIEQSVEFGVSCDDEGSQICQNLCIALAQGARDQAPALICEKLDKHVENLKVAVFTKTICDGNDEWKFTGLKTPEAICCEGGKEVACSSGISQDSSTISPDIV